MVLFGVGCSAPWPTFFAISCRHFPRHRGLLSVFSGVSSTLAWIVFSVVGGLLGTEAGLVWTLRLSPLLALVIVAGGWGVHVAGERRRSEP
jgi:MFS family permease